MSYDIHVYQVVGEGPSEGAYFAQLNKLCREMELSVHFSIKLANGSSPVSFKERYTSFDSYNQIICIPDYDVPYRLIKKGISGVLSEYPTNTKFFLFNFEDFLVQHLDRSALIKWQTICTGFNHFQDPMHSNDIEREIQAIFPGYSKGTMPFTLTQEHLINLKQNNGIFYKKEFSKDFIPVYLDILTREGIIS